MTATTFIRAASHRAASHKGALDAAMAGFAALAVGFVAFAMPGAMFEELVSASGLPSLVTAAQPPLGATARLSVVAAAALISFAALFLVLRALGRPARPRPRPDMAEFDVADPPRLRRADSHPDAPARHPLLAGRDLGEPEIPELLEEWSEDDPDLTPDGVDGVDTVDELPVEWPIDDPALTLEESNPAEELPADQPSPHISFRDSVLKPDPSDDSIAALVARFERGLSRRSVPEADGFPVEAAPRQPAAPEADDRLQSAIESLQRFSRNQD